MNPVYPTDEPEDAPPQDYKPRGTPANVLLRRMRGWDRLHRILLKAARDPEISGSDGAAEWVAAALELIGVRPDEPGSGALGKSSAAEVFEPMRPYFEKTTASRRADLRNAKFREAEQWVIREWDTRRPKAYDSKSKFAVAYVDLVAEKFGVEISARNIVDRWLKGH